MITTEDDTTNGSVPLIPLQRRRNYSPLGSDRLNLNTSYHGPGYNSHSPVNNMSRSRQQLLSSGSIKSAIPVISSYVFDWMIIILILGIAYYLNDKAPNKRPFSLEDPNISFPFTEHETVPTWLLVTLSCGVPIGVILIISLAFVPGHTVPPGTPQSLIWKRKLWELHVGWLGFAVALSSAWFITNGMKNMCGKPRPDALARCNPDVENWTKYIVGGENVGNGLHQLVSADICQGMTNRTDAQSLLEDGFRSYPSGHSSSSAAGLIYLSLFIASKFAITFPFLMPGSHSLSPSSFTAFPSRLESSASYTMASHLSPNPSPHPNDDPSARRLFAAHNTSLASARRQAAAPPLYLLIFAVAPFFTAVFIASSRWFDFRHHGFDILFGFLIGTICAFFAFRWYHLPVSQGAGWAWGPRCKDKAWWAGVGSFSYAMDWEEEERELGTGQRGLGRTDPAAMEEGRGAKSAASVGTAGSVVIGHGFDGEQEARRRMPQDI